MKSLALQLAPDGVTVNAIAPGLIAKDKADGEQTLSPRRMAEAEGAHPDGRSRPIRRISRRPSPSSAPPAARYITGQILHVDGGLVIR